MKPTALRNILIALSFTLFFVSCAGVPIPSGTLRQGESELFSRVKPVFVMPVGDIERGNGIEAVFFHEERTVEGAVIEITVVFRDEDHPSGVTDGLYDIYRSFRYRRKRDVETFYFHFNVDGVRFSRFEFPGTYAEDQVFYEKKVQHYSAEIPAESFDYIRSRPVIHVTTWNHMFREKQTQEDLATVAVGDYLVYPGSRDDAELFLTR